MDTLEKFQEWSTQNGVHLNRHIVVMQKQAQNLRAYVDLFERYPANSVEFKVEVEKLLSQIGDIATEMKEVNDSFAQDCDRFVDILNSLKQDILRVAKK